MGLGSGSRLVFGFGLGWRRLASRSLSAPGCGVSLGTTRSSSVPVTRGMSSSAGPTWLGSTVRLGLVGLGLGLGLGVGLGVGLGLGLGVGLGVGLGLGLGFASG